MSKYQIIKLKWVADLFTGNSIPDTIKEQFTNKKIPYIPTKSLNAIDGSFDYENGLSVDNEDGFKIAPKNSTLMCIEGGSAGRKIGFTDREVAFVNKLCCFNAYNINRKLLYYCLKSKDFTDQFYLNMTGLIGGVSISTLKNLYVSLPSPEIQEVITAVLDSKSEQIDTLISNQEQQIEKLKAYKQSLITEVVTKGLNPNAPMKDSGVEWIGKIPEHWIVVKNNVIFSNFTDKGHGEAEVLSIYRELGVIPKSSRDDNHNVTSLDTDSYKYIETGDLVINKMKAWSGSLAISNYSGIVSPAYYTCKVNKNIVDLHYIHHYLRNRAIVGVYEMYSAGLRIGQWDLGIQDFLNIQIAIPADLEEQKEIAEYLDLKCSQIDKLIEIKQKKIDKLNEYKKSLIYEYVTGKKEA